MNFNPELYFLSNGIPVILDSMDLATTKVKILFQTGGRDEDSDEAGITHFCEHMFCKGTTRFPTQRDADEFLEYNAGYKNAYTSEKSIAFHGRILGENVNVLIDVLCDQIQNSLFDEDEIEIERKVIADELRRFLDNQNNQYLMFRDNVLFGIDKNVLGTFENIEKFSRAQMKDFIAKRLSAKNCIVCVSGCIKDKDSILKCLENKLSFLPQIDVSENQDLIYTPVVKHETKNENKGVKLRIFFPRLYDYAFENRYKRFAVGKLFRYFEEELYNIIRRENGFAYAFSAGHCGNERFLLDYYATTTAPENIAQVTALIAKNLYRLYTNHTVTTDILDRYSKCDRLGDADFLESVSQRCDKLISFYRLYKKLYDFDETNRLHNMITPDEVFDYSRGMFDGEMSVLTYGPDFDADLKQIWIDNFK